MRESVIGVEDESGWESFERYRRGLSWIAIVVFSTSFAGLLALSATAYWSPDNPWIAFLDKAWKLSGFVGICLWAVPYVVRGGRWVAGLFA